MLKRNFLLLIVILVLLLGGLFGWFYFFPPQDKNTGEEIGVVNFLADFLPFGQKINTSEQLPENNTDLSGFIPTGTATVSNSKLKKVSSFPISGYGSFMKERVGNIIPSEGEEQEVKSSTEDAASLRYVNKSNGNVYQTFADSISEVKFSSTTVPLVYESLVGNSGKSIIMRYLKSDQRTIQTFLGELPEEKTTNGGLNSLTGTFLPENIVDISISPDKTKAFYLLSTGEGTIGTVLNLATGSKTQVFDSAFTEWLSEWPSDNMITLTTKASSQVPGFVYSVNPSIKSLNKVLGGINGLTTLASPDGDLVLFGDDNLSLFILNIKTREIEQVGVKTLPEKCVWQNGGESIYCAVPKFTSGYSYPEAWYRGEVSFSDEIWKINTLSGNITSRLIDLSAREGNMDAMKLELSQDNKFLFFINKNDSYLWSLGM